MAQAAVYPDAPGHQATDTSLAAAQAIAPHLGRLQNMVLAAVQLSGTHGYTADELAEHLDIDRMAIRPRATELGRKGLIKDSGQRRQNESGKSAIVWISA